MTGLCGLLAHTAACTALGLAADLAPAAEPPAERAVVEVGTVSVRPVTVESWIPGSIVSRADARIASVIAGRVVLDRRPRRASRQGEPLARLDDTVARLRLEDLRAQVARARAQRDVNNSQLERFNRLAATQALSASQLDDARAQREMSGDDLARAEAQLRQVQYEIEQSVIRAPFPGVVTERFIQRGEYLQTGAATVRLVNTANVEARATAALALAGSVHPGQPSRCAITASSTVVACAPWCRSGTIARASSRCASRWLNPQWLVGMPVEVSLPNSSERSAVTVPRDALVIRQNRSYVLRVTRANTVEELDVTPGAGVADAVEVRGALAAGDRLVIRGGERLVAGQAVRVIDPVQHPAQPNRRLRPCGTATAAGTAGAPAARPPAISR